MARLRRKSTRSDDYLRIFVLESPNPLDALQDRSEGPVLAAIGKLIGHEVLTFLIRSRRELEESCRYMSSIDLTYDAKGVPERPLCLHISAHGTVGGLIIGPDAIDWNSLAKALQSFLEPGMLHRGKRIIVLSSCHAEKQQLSRAIQKLFKQEDALPPKYLFCASGNVAWQDAAVGWTLFYHLLPKVDLDDKKAVQAVLGRIKAVGMGQIFYFRWDDKVNRYKKYAAT